MRELRPTTQPTSIALLAIRLEACYFASYESINAI